jgi:hypothetical protein
MNKLPALSRFDSARLSALIFRLPLWLGLFLFAVYMLSFSGKFHVMDELMGFATAHNWVQIGRPDVNQLIWTNHWQEIPPAWWGVDNNLYTKKAPGLALAAAPFIWLGHALPGLNAMHTGLLLSALATAFTGGLLLVWLMDVGFSRRAAFLTALAYGLGTIAWVYARMLWEPALMALLFLAVAWAVRRADAAATPRRKSGWMAFTGLLLAAGLLLRFEMAVGTALVGLYLLWQALTGRISESANSEYFGGHKSASQRGSESPLHILAARFTLYLLPSLLAGLWLLNFNAARFGSLTETGYNREMAFGAPWVGAYGLLLSPGRGLFIYSPIMILLFFGLRPAWRRLNRPYFLLLAALCLFYWLFYGSWFAWGGTWGWGPRFLMPILPLLMLFVAEPIEWAWQRGSEGASQRLSERAKSESPARSLPLGLLPGPSAPRPTSSLFPREAPLWDRPAAPLLLASRLGIALLAAASLGVNILAVTVDFNEHYLRLGRNDNFVFNWAAMPLLGHWQILREGLVDLLWLRPGPTGLVVDWTILAPALIYLAAAAIGLLMAYLRPYVAGFKVPVSTMLLTLVLLVGLPLVMLRATARAALDTDQARADLPVLEMLSAQARPGDALLVPMLPYGDVQEVTTRLMAYLHTPLPTYTWIESEPRALQPEERERLWQGVAAQARRVWLFERWLTPADAAGPTTVRLNREAFPVHEQWFDHSGRLTLYALPAGQPAPTPLAVQFTGGLTLADFALLTPTALPGGVVQVRLTWQAPPAEELAAAGLPPENIVGFVHLLHETGGAAAQQDRLLLDLQQPARSALLPGQTVAQGYGLPLPADLPPGSYPLIAGLYRVGSGQRLPRADASPDDFIYLANVIIQ